MKWPAGRLGDVVTLKRGHDLPGNTRQDGDVPVVSSSGVTGYHNEAKAKPPGVVTGRYGTLGEVFYLGQDYWPLNTALYVTDFKGNHPKFIAYFLRYLLRSYQSDKAAVPGVDRNVLHEMVVRAPDRDSQRHISEILSAYDELIENNRRRMALLEQAARLLYEEWFVRLRFPGHERARVVNGIPEGFEKKFLGDLLTLKRGYDLPGSSRVVGAFPIVSSSGITGFHREKKATAPGVVTGRYGTLGEVFFVQQDYWPLNTSLYVSDFKGTRPSFAAHLLRHALAGAQSDKAAVPGLNRNVAHQLPVVCPPRDLRDRFADFADVGYRERHVLEAASEKLQAARNLLLPRLMNGEIDA